MKGGHEDFDAAKSLQNDVQCILTQKDHRKK